MTRRHGRKLDAALVALERFTGTPEHVDRLYAERAQAIRTAHAAGAGVKTIADRLGVPRSVVYRAIENGNTKEDR